MRHSFVSAYSQSKAFVYNLFGWGIVLLLVMLAYAVRISR
jgi:hypothetical protein